MRKQSAVSDRAAFLSPEAPYPLAGGGPMRSASLLHFLAQRFRVHLITFFEQRSQTPEPCLPEGLAERVTSIGLPYHDRGTWSRIRRNTGRLIRGKLPLTARFSEAESMNRVARATESEKYAVAVVEHFWCAPYGPALRSRADRIVLDLHNVESALHDGCWRTEPWPHKIGHGFFRSTARRMERELLVHFDLVLVASEADRERVLDVAPEARVAVYPNALPLVDPGPVREENVVAFSGNLEYHPNVSGVKYFRKKVWPLLRNADPTLRWRLIGKNESGLRGVVAQDPRIELTGPVADGVQELARAKVVVVPLLAGSGTRVKILEAWAAGRAVVSTAVGAEGLPAVDGSNIRIVDEPRRMAEAVRELLGNERLRRRLGEAGRATYERELCWPAAWKRLEPHFELLFPAPACAMAM